VPADVAGVNDQIHLRKHVEDLRTQQSVCVRNQANDDRTSPHKSFSHEDTKTRRHEASGVARRPAKPTVQ
jgi:hypothetical protein